MDKLQQYIEEHSAAEDELLTELDRATNLRVIQPKMVSGRVQGTFLKLITEILQPRLVLEIGTFTGYSALSIAAGMGGIGLKPEEKEAKLAVGLKSEKGEAELATRRLKPTADTNSNPDSKSSELSSYNQKPELHTIEVDDELEDIVRSFFVRSPHGSKIHLHIGSALEVVPELAKRLGRPFDMVFIDGDKREYPDYYRMLMGDGETPLMVRRGGIILADNVLWYGKVLGQTPEVPNEPNAPDDNALLNDPSPQADGNKISSQPRQDKHTQTRKASDRHTQGIVEFNRLVAGDRRVENVILPLRDGINIIRVK